jgi:hypothetical protein
MGQNFAQIVPNQLIQLLSGDISGRAASMHMGVNDIELAATDIIGVAGV